MVSRNEQAAFLSLSAFSRERERARARAQAYFKGNRNHGHDCLYSVFLGNICMYSHAIGLAIHVVDCHDFG